jgi:hypothetical protein
MLHAVGRALVLGSIVAIVACGPAGRNDGSGGGGGGGGDANGLGGAENTPETCSDGVDNNGNGTVDCADPSCSGIGACPVCGMVEHPTGTPIDLPDGIGGNICTTDADCAALSPGPQHCFDLQGGSGKECRQSYTSKVHFGGFGPTQTMTMPSDVVSVCVTMSHEWIRDVEIDLIAPSGQKIALDKFEGQSCGSGVCEVFLGHPLVTDSDCDDINGVNQCTAEMGMQYCWTPTSTKPSILGYADASGTMQSWQQKDVMPADNYSASDPWSTLVGATLNGDWTISVTDLWPIDAGKLHDWTIAFNPMIVQDCSGPVIQ